MDKLFEIIIFDGRYTKQMLYLDIKCINYKLSSYCEKLTRLIPINYQMLIAFKLEFTTNHTTIRRHIPKNWKYCKDINTTIITRRAQNIFVGKVEPNEQIHQSIVLYNDGLLYQGQIKQYKKQGIGRLISSDGDCYQGNWKSNQAHGQGIYQGGNPRRKYEGIWNQGNLQGNGKAHYEDGSIYQGDFHLSMRHGKGTIKYPDGSTYEGDFLDNEINGYGVLIGINHKYEGSWKEGKMDGKGKSYWYNDQHQIIQSYEGQYRNNLKHGFGLYKWSNGKVYKGEWFQGEVKKIISK